MKDVILCVSVALVMMGFGTRLREVQDKEVTACRTPVEGCRVVTYRIVESR